MNTNHKSPFEYPDESDFDPVFNDGFWVHVDLADIKAEQDRRVCDECGADCIFAYVLNAGEGHEYRFYECTECNHHQTHDNYEYSD